MFFPQIFLLCFSPSFLVMFLSPLFDFLLFCANFVRFFLLNIVAFALVASSGPRFLLMSACALGIHERWLKTFFAIGGRRRRQTPFSWAHFFEFSLFCENFAQILCSRQRVRFACFKRPACSAYVFVCSKHPWTSGKRNYRNISSASPAIAVSVSPLFDFELAILTAALVTRNHK